MNLKHQFLLSMPGLHGSYFASTLIYITEHHDEGALGFVVNRKTSLTLDEVFEQLNISCSNEKLLRAEVHEGGPVAKERGFVLYNNTDYDDSDSSESGIKTSASLELLDQIASGDGPEQFLLILGYSGWGAGQLETEIAQNSWLTCAADLAIVFEPDSSRKFTLAANTLGVDLSLMSADAGHA